MKTKKSESKATTRRRKRRARPTPKWISKRPDIDEMARRRCLMVLSVLSGERPVTEVIAEAQISRGTYYQLEERALCAMLAALSPGLTDDATSTAETPAKRIAELETKVTMLERAKRRAERLLFLTRKVLKPGPMKMKVGRPRRVGQRTSTTSGSTHSRGSKNKTTATEPESPSTPMRSGEGER
jgi:hypothetical protein